MKNYMYKSVCKGNLFCKGCIFDNRNINGVYKRNIWSIVCLVIIVFIIFGIRDELKYKRENEIMCEKMYDSICLQKHYNKILNMDEREQISKSLLELFHGKVVIKEKKINVDYNKEVYVLYAYSKRMCNEMFLYGKKVNLNIVYTMVKDEGITNVYIGNPIVNIEY